MEKVFAILGDIHSNLDALNVVMDDCRANGVTDFLCTGDVIGYNACPRECLKIVRDLGCPVVMGNHDYYVSHRDEVDTDDFNENAAKVIDWTRSQLTGEEVEYLANLPFSVVKMGIGLVHSTLDRPERFGYVFEIEQAKSHFVNQLAPLCFHGHTHCPMVFGKKLDAFYKTDSKPLSAGNVVLNLPIGSKYFVNVGSVGQPRDGDPRASYVIYNPKTRDLRFRRLEYDVEAAQERVRLAGLPERLAMRLAIGQ